MTRTRKERKDTTYQIRIAEAMDHTAILALINGEAAEPTRLEDFEAGEAFRLRAGGFVRLVAAAPDGSILGHGTARIGQGLEPGHCFLRVFVAPDRRGAGIGRALFAQLSAWARQHPVTHLNASASDGDLLSQAWAERRGFGRRYHIFDSRLSLAGWEVGRFGPHLEGARRTGIRFSTLAAEAEGEALYRRYFDLADPLMQAIPGAAGRVRGGYEQWRANVAQNRFWTPELIALAVQGERWVALSRIDRRDAGSIYNAFTGVVPQYQGRGLGLAVKAHGLHLAQQAGARYARTNNHSVNLPMLAINRRLGYQPETGIYTLEAAWQES